MASSQPEKNKVLIAPSFSPPLFRQRYKSVAGLLSKFGKGTLNKVVDIGCSSFGLFPYLKHVKGIKEMVFMDIDYLTLKDHCGKIDPLPFDFIQMRNTPLAVSVLCADARFVHAALRDSDVVLMIEFIEHLVLDDLSKVVEIVFSGIMPKLIIMTTPNRDFNKYFGTLREGTFRHFDHKFEFTQREFEEWCSDAVSKFPFYDVSFTGCGGPFEGIFCTQTAIFVRNKISSTLSVSKITNPLPDGRYDKLSSSLRPCHKSCSSKESCHVILSVEYPYDKRTPEERRCDGVKRSWLDFRCFLRNCLNKVYDLQANEDTPSDSAVFKSNEPSFDKTDCGIIYSKHDNSFSFNIKNKFPKKEKKTSKDGDKTSTVEEKKIIVKFVTDKQSMKKEVKCHINNLIFYNEYKESFYILLSTFRLWAGTNIKIKNIEEILKDIQIKTIEVNKQILYVICIGRHSDDESD